MPIGHLVMEMGFHVGQRRPGRPGAVPPTLPGPGPAARVIPAVPVTAALRIDHGDFLSVMFQTVVPETLLHVQSD